MEETDELVPEAAINDLLLVQLPDDVNFGNYYSRVENITEKNMEVTWPTERGVPMPVRTDQMLRFFIVRKDSAYFFDGMVEKTIREPLPIITIIVSSAMQRIQRRQDFRVKCLVPLEIIATLSGVSSGLNPATLHLKMNTYDLSASGVSLRTTTVIPEGTLPLLQLSLPDGGPPIKASSRVVHRFIAPENPDTFHVGIQFMALEENNRTRIVRFIYHTELNRIRS